MDFTSSIPAIKEIERRVVILSIMDIDGNQFIKEGTSDNGHDVITWKNADRTFLIDVDANRLFEWVKEACVDTDMSRLMRFCVNHQLHKRLEAEREKPRKVARRAKPRSVGMVPVTNVSETLAERGEREDYENRAYAGRAEPIRKGGENPPPAKKRRAPKS